MDQTIVNDIWLAIEPTPELAAHMRVKSELLIAVQASISKRGLRQKEVAAILGVSQPRVSDLLRGSIERFSLDSLVEIAYKLGLEVELHVKSSVVDA
jgi:predicted XRE-type DNA-binding protein